jgi:hypothetical protein
MIHWLTTPIGFLTPYIALWSMLNGLLTIGLLQLLKLKTTRLAQLATAVTTAIASMLWNWSIEFSQATIHLNVDHPVLRISWADALNGVCVGVECGGVGILGDAAKSGFDRRADCGDCRAGDDFDGYVFLLIGRSIV